MSIFIESVIQSSSWPSNESSTLQYNDSLLFNLDNIVSNNQLLYRDSSTGNFIINSTGKFFISWWVSASSANVNNSIGIGLLVAPNGTTIPSTINPVTITMQNGEISGTAVLEVSSGDLPVSLSLNNLTGIGSSQTSALVLNLNNQFAAGISIIQLVDSSTGATGATGSRGAAGSLGPRGIPGVKGDIGLPGVTGSQGAQGIQGPVGPQGLQGIQGVQGLAGLTGAQGLEGPVGPIGPAGGPTGPQGIQGEVGPTGPAGGPPGPQGIQGDVGPQGPAGSRGPQGNAGPRGDIGPQGKSGDRGPQGQRGDRGPQGLVGSQGRPGADGSIGPAGPAGPTGPAGPRGSRGFIGARGLPGLNGDSNKVSLLTSNLSSSTPITIPYNSPIGFLKVSTNSAMVSNKITTNSAILINNTDIQLLESGLYRIDLWLNIDNVDNASYIELSIVQTSNNNTILAQQSYPSSTLGVIIMQCSILISTPSTINIVNSSTPIPPGSGTLTLTNSVDLKGVLNILAFTTGS